MKTNKSLILAFILLTAFIACKKDKKDDTAQNLTLLALLNNGNNGQLTPEQKSVSSTANGAVNAATAAQNNGAMTASNDIQTEQMLVARVFENGMDPIVAKETSNQIIALHKSKKENPVHLTAITPSAPTGASPNLSYTFTGDVPGNGINVTSTDVGAFLGMPGCSIDVITASGAQGTATFANGTLAYTGSGNAGAFNGTSALTADVTFNNYGVFYSDWLAFIQLAKNPPSSTPDISTCEGIKSAFGSVYSIMNKYAIINSGDASVVYNRTYSGQSSTSSVLSNSKFDATINSPAGLNMTEYEGAVAGTAKTVTLQNVKYEYESTVAVSNPSAPVVSGSFSISFSGTVNGVAIDQIFSFNF
ncbi:hypothetical protein EHQ12_12485 [Leptospira gomenensis]|uniref:Lipoprotein n=1 Tax=Leptospira gomenensis TaxID=2484974 RepID=A0A5F1YNH3_9LEPT|nr:hypothetical protein [Leptospira gomenensis]TGK32749.1 hypothetical protein EHQ17_12330 [Leptospira gomenensis]TGK36897.1 hypothetical protein EHQ12_12485 [Leptospira gomenensis]TGK44368.1 hypothetical protein EHQ07_11800 [Leptospira gomenensis]TGK58861.1 hypothetical protein EHQ13_13620 [Leptospira gomenensis]